ncbi:hypothetical protein TNCV_3615001 [Trichonephila clavipes]|nr:hypothetical protein TNCV_3615001 [Trichonephila clavipes]
MTFVQGVKSFFTCPCSLLASPAHLLYCWGIYPATVGYETVSDTMTWALYLIGLYPDVQEKIHEELDRIFGSDVDRCVTENDLNELKYLDCVLKVGIFSA